MASRIPIHVSNYTAFVWNVDHVAALRSEHRICGVLSGTLPHLSQQNVFLGLPLVLMPEELVLLVEKQLATIVYDPAAHHSPMPAQLEAWDASRRQDIAQDQVARLERRRKTEDRAPSTSTSTTTTIGTTTASSTSTAVPIDVEQDALTAVIQQKRAEREARRRQRLAAAVAAAADSNAGADADAEADVNAVETLASGEGDRGAAVPSSSVVYTVSVPTTSDSFAWYNNDEDEKVHHIYETLDAARTAGVWSYPASADERARCEVFRDLWEKGYYMGGGVKFGGDWLVYPGDPLRYHSHFVATVQTSPSASLRPMEVVAHGRLGTATKKAHLLCGWDPESREVTYISIEWAGFG